MSSPPPFNTYWGDSHHNLFVSSDRNSVDLAKVCGEARAHLDFMPFAYYTALAEWFRPEANPPGKSGIQTERLKPVEQRAHEWAQIEEAARAFHEPGRFVTFPGYEWHGDGTPGDHNVYHLREGMPVHDVATLPELVARLRGQPVLAIPHHTAYAAGHRSHAWQVVDETLTPFTEIFSCHGCSETDEEWVGMRANVIEFEADPAAILSVSINGQTCNGPVASFAASSRAIGFEADCVRMLRDLHGFGPEHGARHDPFYDQAYKAKLHRAIPEAGFSARLDFIDDEPLSGEAHYRVRVEQRNGQRAWSSPIWIRPSQSTLGDRT